MSTGGVASQSSSVQIVKLLLIGNSGVGKSSILLRFVEDKFLPSDMQATTIGVDYKYKIIEKDGQKIKLAIWDTAGQDKFRTLTASYYRGSHGVILVYDVTQRSSFDSLTYWLGQLEIHSNNPHVTKIIVGNKIDREEERQVSKEEGRDFAKRHSALFIETSAKTRAGLEQCFDELVVNVLREVNLEKERENERLRLDVSQQPATTNRGPVSSMCGC